jgi:hypothetical protein
MNCVISQNERTGITGDESYLTVSNCIITEMEGVGVSFDEVYHTLIDSCHIAGNGDNGLNLWGSNATISNSTIEGNNGRGIQCVSSSPNIDNCIISDNAFWSGSGIYCKTSSHPAITNCLITNNQADKRGAGIYCYHAFPTVANCRIIANTAQEGAGIYCEGFSYRPIFRNCIIANNAAIYGAGIYCYKWSDPVIINCTITDNTASSVAGGFYSNIMPFYPIVINTIVWNNSPEEIVVESGYQEDIVISYSDIQGGWPGEANIDIDPLFRNPENGDYHLMAVYCGDPYDSPCIDTGHPDSLDSILDCWYGLGTERADMGAYGGGNTGWLTSIVEMNEQASVLPGEFRLDQNYPNPFNSQTEIGYYLPQSEIITLRLFNIRGQIVVTLIDGLQEAGSHHVTWDAREYSSGIYFAKLEVGGKRNTIKMILLK